MRVLVNIRFKFGLFIAYFIIYLDRISDRVVYGTSFESCHSESCRGFESYLIRNRMKFNFKVKSKLSGSISSDGSFNLSYIPGYSLQRNLECKTLDLLNHPVWTGKRIKDQTEITSFINRFHKAN